MLSSPIQHSIHGMVTPYGKIMLIKMAEAKKIHKREFCASPSTCNYGSFCCEVIKNHEESRLNEFKLTPRFFPKCSKFEEKKGCNQE